MNIQVVNKGKNIGTIRCDFDSIMLEAETRGRDVFFEAIGVLEQFISKNFQGYKLLESGSEVIQKYLRKFAALGYIETPLYVDVQRTEVVNPMIDISVTSFEEVVSFPNSQFKERYDRLIGLDDLKCHILKESAVLMAPELLDEWSMKFYRRKIAALKTFNDRYPFFIFEGDVGTGKTEFAETFGNTVAEIIKKDVLLARISMKSRGNGVVGEMSKLISKVFQDAKLLTAKTKCPLIMLLDEADSLAQSREESQMHHEDRAGVNALIQGIDHVRESQVPILVVFCTNRVQAIDPAIKRRASLIQTFTRPNFGQRAEVFKNCFSDINITQKNLELLSESTGENNDRSYGFTYSDLLTRVIPHSVLNAYPDQKITYEILLQTIKEIKPTVPFRDSNPQ